jgi:methionine sulfoxide reductase heme-binding subunit
MAILSTRTIQRLKPVVLVAMLVPLALMAFHWVRYFQTGFSTALGANPVQFTIQELGLWALRFLILGLAITPLAKHTQTPALTAWRRRIGLVAFAYAALHLMVFFALDLELSLSALVREVTKRNYILLGMVGFILLLPLAITSTSGMIKWLGAKRWRNLHRAVYAAVLLGGVHFIFMVKGNQLAPKVYLAIIIALLAARFLPARRKIAVATI